MSTLKRFVLFTVLTTILSCPCSQAHAEANAKECIISGTITSSEGNPISGVVLRGFVGRIMTDTNGFYQANVPSGFIGRITPVREGYVFEPSFCSYNSLIKDFQQVDYSGRAITLTISGTVTSSDGKSISGVVLDGFPEKIMTDTNGHYEAKVSYGFRGGIVPRKEGYRFAPAGIPYNQVTKDLRQCDYRGGIIMYSISGNVGLSGVVLRGLPQEVRSDGSGNYKALVQYGWSGTVTPVKEGCTFVPNCKSYPVVKQDMEKQSFACELAMVSIRDRFTTSDGKPIPGVRVEADNEGGSAVSDGHGEFSVQVPYGWSGELRFSCKDFAIAPSVYHNVVANIDERGPAGPPVPKVNPKQSSVMIVPTGEVSPDEFAGISKDLKVMLHILKQAVKKESSDPARNVFADLGELLERNRPLFEAMYIQDYGVLFFLTADFEPSPIPGTVDPLTAAPKKPADTVWQQAQATLFQQNRGDNRATNRDSRRSSEELVQKLISSLKHASNIARLPSERVIIVTVLSKVSYSLEMTNPTVTHGYWSKDGASKMTSVPLAGNAYVSSVSPTTITLCVQKEAIDAFATGQLTLEEFSKQVKVSTY
jgi:hypothetical protein